MTSLSLAPHVMIERTLVPLLHAPDLLEARLDEQIVLIPDGFPRLAYVHVLVPLLVLLVGTLLNALCPALLYINRFIHDRRRRKENVQ